MQALQGEAADNYSVYLFNYVFTHTKEQVLTGAAWQVQALQGDAAVCQYLCFCTCKAVKQVN